MPPIPITEQRKLLKDIANRAQIARTQGDHVQYQRLIEHYLFVSYGLSKDIQVFCHDMDIQISQKRQPSGWSIIIVHYHSWLRDLLQEELGKQDLLPAVRWVRRATQLPSVLALEGSQSVLVVIAGELTERSGLEAIRLAKHVPRARLQVVYLQRPGSHDDARSAYHAGADLVLDFPGTTVEVPALVNRLHALIETQLADAATSGDAAPGAARSDGG